MYAFKWASRKIRPNQRSNISAEYNNYRRWRNIAFFSLPDMWLMKLMKINNDQINLNQTFTATNRDLSFTFLSLFLSIFEFNERRRMTRERALSHSLPQCIQRSHTFNILSFCTNEMWIHRRSRDQSLAMLMLRWFVTFLLFSFVSV